MYSVKPIIYKTVEEKRNAFMQAVQQRQKWEAEQREKIAKMDASKASAQA